MNHHSTQKHKIHRRKETACDLSSKTTGWNTPRQLTLEMPLEWISTESYKHALRLLDKAKRTIALVSLQPGSIEVYVLSESQDPENKLNSVNHDSKGTSIRQYQRTLQGETAGFGRFDYKRACKYSFCMHMVKERTEEQQGCSSNVCPDGNPLDLACTGCPAYYQCGVCAHILAVTHLYYGRWADEDRRSLPRNANIWNVRYQTATLYGSTGRRVANRSTRDRGARHRDMDTVEEEENDTNVHRNNWYG